MKVARVVIGIAGFVCSMAGTLFAAEQGKPAASFTWTSPSAGNWSDGAKWNPATAPVATGGADHNLIFSQAGTYAVTNDLNEGFLLNTLTLGALDLTLAGRGVAFNANGGALPQIIKTGDSGVTISLPINLLANLSCSGTGKGELRLSGGISGSGSLTQNGAGYSLRIQGDNSYSGGTTINAGAILVDRVNSPLGTGPVTVNNGGTLHLCGNDKLTETNMEKFSAATPLYPSGLLGPVRLLTPVGNRVGAEAATHGANAQPMPKVIALRPDPSSLECLAANEVRRYVYLRTGTLLPVERGVKEGDRIVVSRKDAGFCGESGKDLEPQQFTLKAADEGGRRVWWIVGGDEVGVLYGAYRFAEKLGVRFGLDEDILPDVLLTGGLPGMAETGKPRFALRGLQPFHDFSVGPDWWNLHDYQSVLSQMAKLRMNFIGLHTYPSWNPAAGPEANVWIGLPEDVDKQGNVKSGYEAGVVTTRRGWEVTPFPTDKYASGAGLLFEDNDYAPDFLLDCPDWPKTAEAATAMFNRYGDFQKRAFEHARGLGIKTCLGTELPLGVPTELASRLEARGMKADDPAVIQRLYEGVFLRLMRKMPIDYYWFWTPETWLKTATLQNDVERDLGLIQSAAGKLQIPFGLATCGWRLGTPDDALWTDTHTPKDWAASAINTSIGRDPVEPAFGTMSGRPKWVIGWAEDDGTAGAHCCTCWDLQLWVERMFANSADASRYGCEGMMAIHWRTAAISPNIAALSQAGWEFNGTTPGPESFWADWGRGLFGGDPGAEAGRLMKKLDGCHKRINELIDGGTQTTDEEISRFFAPLSEMEGLRSRMEGAGNLERFDYWLNFIRASRLRVQTWVMAARLEAKMREAGTIGEADQARQFAGQQILPLRVKIARNYEDMITAFLNCAKSPGEVGTVASIEYGMRNQIVNAHDDDIAKLLGKALPEKAAIRTAYQGTPRIFVSSKCSQINAGNPHEIRAFVLSGAKCTGVNLHWRLLGEQTFRKSPATHGNRQAYRVALPDQSEGTLEYYLEAVLDNGHKVLWPATAPAINQTTVVW